MASRDTCKKQDNNITYMAPFLLELLSSYFAMVVAVINLFERFYIESSEQFQFSYLKNNITNWKEPNETLK